MRMKMLMAFLLTFMMMFSSVNVFAEDEVPATDDVAEVVEETEEVTETEEVVTAGTTEETVEPVKTNVSATSYKVEQVEGTRNITVTMSGLDKLISSKKYDEVRVYFKMYYKSKAVVSKTVKQKLSEIDAETKAFKATVPYYGKYKVTVKLYKKKKKKKTLSKKTLGVTAKKYNILDLNATTPVLISSLKILTGALPTYEEKAGEGEAAEATEGEEEAEKEKIEIPTIVTLYRGGAYNWKALPEHVYKCPYIKDSINSKKGKGPTKYKAIKQYVKDLYNLDKTSHFTFYINDYNMGRLIEVAYENKIPDQNMSLRLVTDGSATYAMFKATYGSYDVGEAQAYHDKLVDDYKKFKAAYYKGKTGKLHYGTLANYAYAALDAETDAGIDSEWWVVRKSAGDTFNIKDTEFRAKAVADTRITSNYINNLLGDMQKADMDEVFKKWYNFDDSQIKNAIAAGKIPMMILGTSFAGEDADPIDPFVRFTMAYYGGDYAYFYKGHPGYITEDDPERVAKMKALGMDILDSSIAAELFCYYNEDLHMSGYQSSTFQNIGDEETHGGIYNVRPTTANIAVYKDTIDFTIIKLSKVNDEALTALAKDAGHENYLVEFNTGKEYDVAIWDADTSYAYYYKKDDEGNYNLEKEEYALKPQTITTSKTSYTVKKGKTVKLGAATSGNGLLTYKSSNKKVAKVSSKGTVTGVKKGKVTITVTASSTGANEKATKKVTVTVK